MHSLFTDSTVRDSSFVQKQEVGKIEIVVGNLQQSFHSKQQSGRINLGVT